LRLTEVQRQVLQFLQDGSVMSVDRHNTAWCADRPIQLNTQQFLRTNKLIKKIDTSRPAHLKGNGYVITVKGLAILRQQPASAKHANNDPPIDDQRDQKHPPTEKQLKYALELGLEVPNDASIEEVSDLISAHIDDDEKSGQSLLLIASQYNVRHTRFTGKRELFNRIFICLNPPTREVDLLAWFILQVYKNIGANFEEALRRPDREEIYQIAKELAGEEAVVKSVRRYSGDLTHFREWEDSEGYIRSGASTRTCAYQRVATELKNRFRSE
jgi:hypothetical protein